MKLIILIRHLILFLIFSISSGLFGQSNDFDSVKEVNRQALDLNRNGKFTEAREKLEGLLVSLEKDSLHQNYKAITWQTLAKVVMNLGEYEESFTLARRSLSFAISANDSINIADNYNTIGINHYHLSAYDSTTYYYEKSLELKRKLNVDPYSLAVSEYNLGIVYEDLGNSEKAIEFYKAAEENLIKSGVKANFLSDVYVGMAHIYFYSGDSDTAEVYAEKSMNEGLISYGENNPNMTFVYTSYANILEYRGKFKEAIELLEKSLDIRRRSYGESHRWTCETYYDLANSYALAEQYEKAEELFERAIAIGERTRSEQYLSYAQTYLAGLYLDQEKNLEEAEELLLISLEKKRQIFGDINEVVAENYSRLARLAMLRDDESSFFRNIDQGMMSANYRKDSIQNVIAPLHALEALMLKGEWFQKQYEDNRDQKNLLNSYALLEEEVTLVWHIQKNFSTDRSKIDLASEYRQVFEAGMDLCWQLYQNTRDKKYLDKAFDLSEANRNAALLQGLQDIRYKFYADIPTSLLNIEKKLKSDLEKVKMDLYYEKSASEPDKEVLKGLLNQRIGLTYSLDSLDQTFSINYPKYKDLKYQNTNIDLKQVQESLDEDSQLLSYFLGEENLYSFTITHDTVKFLRSDIAKKIIDKTNEFKRNLVAREDVIEIAKELYLYLMYQQVQPNKKKMILVPDNVLNYIPFEILTDQYDQHLLDAYSIGYAGSARLYLELQNEFLKYQQENSWAGFAPQYEEDLRLSSNEDEIIAISEIADGDVFLGKMANKDNFLQNNKNHSILHLAMHAEIDNSNPLYNKLIFSDEELTYSEIYISESRANLAVLSACNTGFGKIEKGEGVMSMARAFHFSGIPSVVMSLWKVPDRATKTIMLSFYKYLKEGDSKSLALKKAKLDYLNQTQDRVLRHPYYWAGFVVNGNTDSLEVGSQINKGWYLALLTGIVLITAVGFRKRRNKDKDYSK